MEVIMHKKRIILKIVCFSETFELENNIPVSLIQAYEIRKQVYCFRKKIHI